MKKLVSSTLLISSLSIVGFAQQDAQFSQFMFNKQTINPGYVGTNKALCATAVYRTQWVSFPGAPKTFLFSGDAFLLPAHGGVGLTVWQDQLGFDKSFSAKAAYSFHVPLGAGTLGVGLEMGMLQKTLSNQWVATQRWQDDPAIPNGVSTITYDVGFGAFYTTNQLYFGISSTHLPESSLKKGSIPSFEFKLARHYYIMAGYDFQLGSAEWELKPCILVKSDAASTQMDMNLSVMYDKMVWAGLSYRLTDAVAPMLGYQHDLGGNKGILKIGYSYDVTTSELKNYSNNSHEIMVNYCFKIKPKNKTQSHQNVRFL